jgi:regulator of nucleoside diphosphate kinase
MIRHSLKKANRKRESFKLSEATAWAKKVRMNAMPESKIQQRALLVAEPDARRLRGLLAARRQSGWRDETHLDELELELERALLVTTDAVPADLVVMDSVVSVLDLANGDRREYTLVYPGEADLEAGRISVLAPLGTALLGYREGDEVEWLMPGGLRRLRIVKVRSRHETVVCN